MYKRQLPISTFTIGNFEKAYNEAMDAKKIANFLGTHHTELYITEADYLSIVPEISEIYDEPFADSSQIPTYLVNKLAKQHITVAVTGDGGDELFGGYNRHIFGEKIFHFFEKQPKFLKATYVTFLKRFRSMVREKGPLYKILEKKLHIGLLSDKIQKTLDSIAFSNNYESFYFYLTSIIKEDLTTLKAHLDCLPGDNFVKEYGFTNWMMLSDTKTYLHNDVLTKVDRASMRVSLETRTPFLDKEVFETAWKIPLQLKVKNKSGKNILKSLLKEKIPEDLFMNRPKTGFGIPLGSWLRGPLYQWAYDLLQTDTLSKFIDYDREKVNRMWESHQNGKFDYSQGLWNIIILNDWLNKNVKYS